MKGNKEIECDYYEVLEVSKFASKSEIEKAYKKKLREYDVDKLKYFGEKIRDLAEKEAKLIQEAYDVLSNPERRKSYNQEIKMRKKKKNVIKEDMKRGAEIHNNRAIEYWNAQQYEKAMLEWKKGLEIAPQMAELYHNLANAFLNLGRYDKAIILWERTVEIHPNLKEAYNNLGCAYYKIGNPTLAAKNWKKVVELDPGCEQARRNLKMLVNDSRINLDLDISLPSNKSKVRNNNSKKGVFSRVFRKFKKYT